MAGKKVIFLFPGQGAQYPGMGLDLLQSPAAKKVFDAAGAVLGRDMAAFIRDSDAETLKRTDVSQPAMSAASLAAAACLQERGVVPVACAGFSLGEYPALACAGVISLEDCFRLTEARGRAMQAAAQKPMAFAMEFCPGAALHVNGVCSEEGQNSSFTNETNSAVQPGGMAAVLGLSPQTVESLIAEWKNGENPGNLVDLYAANINSPKQVVVSGTAAALLEAEKRFKEAGARRVLRLQVAGPFHSPFMKEAAEEFAPVLEQIRFNDPAIPLFSNVTGKQIRSGAEAKALALRQIVEGVRWTEEEAALAALRPDAVFETGPGSVLQGLWRDTGADIPAFGAGTLVEIEASISAL